MRRKLYWILTNRCNLGCRYCYYNTGLAKRNSQSFDLKQLKKIVPEIKQSFDEVVFTGGEPLLSPHLFPLARFAKKQGLAISLLTNGVLLNKEFRQKLPKLNLDTLSVSLDSLNSEINDQQRGRGALVLVNLKQLLILRPKKLVVEVMQTVTRQNIAEILTMHKFCQENNLVHWVDPVEINPKIKSIQQFALGKAKQSEFKQFQKNMLIWADKDKLLINYTTAVMKLIKQQRPTNLTCPMGTDNFVLEADGNLYPCFSRKDINLGNVHKRSLTSILNNSILLTRFQPELSKAKCVSLGCVCMTIANNY